MKTVTVDKARLLKALKANKETHVADFELAWAKYHDAVIENAKALLKNAKNMRKREPVSLYISLEAPVDHSTDYDTAVEMIDWEQSEEVELTQAEFQQFVQDDWQWKAQFLNSNILYTGSASPSSA